MSDRITNRFAIIQTPFHLVAKHFRLMIRLARMFLNSFFLFCIHFLKSCWHLKHILRINRTDCQKRGNNFSLIRKHCLLLNAAIDTENNQLLHSWTLNRMKLMTMLKSRTKPTEWIQCMSIFDYKNRNE